MAGNAGTAFVDLEPRFGGGWTTAVTAEAKRAATAGSQELSGFATKTGGLFQSLDRQLAGFGVPLTGQLSTIGTHLQGVATAEGEAASGAARLGQVGTAAFLGIAAAAAGIGAISAKAFLEGQGASVGYQQALKNVGESEDALHPKLEKTVDLLATYGEENDAVEISATQLTRATKDGSKALDDVSLAADIAAGRRISLASATGILVKVETGHVALLGRLGINTKDATGATITQEEAIKRLTDLYGGSAAAQAKTYAGELRAVGAEAHNLEEELGGKIVPAVANFGKGLLDGVHAIESVNGATDGWLGTLTGVALVGGGVLVAVNKITSGLESLGGWLKTTTGLTTAHAEASVADAAATEDAAVAITASTEGRSAALVTEAGNVTAAGKEAAAATLEQEEAYAALTGTLDSATIAMHGLTEADLEQIQVWAALTGEEESAIFTTAALTGEVEALVVAEESATVSTGFLAEHLSSLGVGGILAAVAGGFLLGKTAGDKLNETLGGVKPNVDDLVTSLEDLATTGTADGAVANDFGDHLQKLAGDLKTIKGNTLEKGFGLAPSAHEAVKDIGSVNDALVNLLDTKGPDVATKAFGELAGQLEADGISAQVVGQEFAPFIGKLQLAAVHARDTAGASKELGESLDELANKQLAKQSAQLSIADSFDQVKTAEDALTQARLNEEGKGDDAIAAARSEANAREGLTSAIESQADAARTLGEANAKLAEFEGPTDQRVRVLQREQITDRVVTTPEEARQKEIDLLQFDENTADQKQQLQKQVAAGERGVEDATKRVGDAQQGVEDAVKARTKLQTDSADLVRQAENKVKEAVINVATEIDKASVAGQLNNKQLQAYLTLLEGIAKTTDPNGVLAKNLAGIVASMGKIPLNGVDLSTVPPSGSSKNPFSVKPGDEGDISPGFPGGPSSSTGAGPSVHVDARQEIHLHGSDKPTTQELDTLNKKQAIRIGSRVAGGRH